MLLLSKYVLDILVYFLQMDW